MKSIVVAIVLSAAVFAAVAAQPSKRDARDIKQFASFVVEKEFIHTGEPVSVGNDTYEVPVKIGDKECKLGVRPNDKNDGPWRWKLVVMNCSK